MGSFGGVMIDRYAADDKMFKDRESDQCIFDRQRGVEIKEWNKGQDMAAGYKLHLKPRSFWN